MQKCHVLSQRLSRQLASVLDEPMCVTELIDYLSQPINMDIITETAGQPLQSIKPIQINHTATQCISEMISMILTAW